MSIGTMGLAPTGVVFPFSRARNTVESNGRIARTLMVGDLGINKRKGTTMKISELSHEQAVKLVKLCPEWLVAYRPELVANLCPSWMADNRSEWMVAYRTAWMTAYRSDWMLTHPHAGMVTYRMEWILDRRPDWKAMLQLIEVPLRIEKLLE